MTSALNPELVAGVLDVLREIAANTDITLLCVTHEMGFARDISDRVLMFDHSRVVKSGPPEQLFSAPEQPRTREFRVRSSIGPAERHTVAASRRTGGRSIPTSTTGKSGFRQVENGVAPEQWDNANAGISRPGRVDCACWLDLPPPVEHRRGRAAVKRYGQHCPIARAAEVLTETWTLLVIRECLRGSETSADIARGVGGMSGPLLAARLRTLVQTGILSCEEQARGEPRYRLSDAGRELAPVLEHLGHWGQRWLPRPSIRDHDRQLLLLDISAEIDRLLLPQDRTVLHVSFADSPRLWPGWP